MLRSGLRPTNRHRRRVVRPVSLGWGHWATLVIMLSSLPTVTVGQEGEPAPPRPRPSWIYFFTHAAQWDGAPHADVFGVVQPSATWSGSSDWATRFGFTRARLGVRGATSRPLSFFVLVELARNGVTAPTGGAVRLLDAQVNLRVSNAVNVRMGQFLPDGGRLITPGVFVSWVDYTDIEKAVLFFNRMGDSESSAARDMGVSLWNDFAAGRYRFQYEIGVYNGTGLRQDDADGEKDFVASARLGIGSWLAKAGHWRGSRVIGDERLGVTKWTASLGWGDLVDDPLWIMGEYLRSSQAQPRVPARIRVDGFFVAGGWWFTGRVQLGYRFAYCRCSDALSPPGPHDSRVHTMSLTYRIAGHQKLLFEYDLRTDLLDSRPSADSDAARFFMSVPFSFRIRPRPGPGSSR